jgi:hypothetical protein
MFNCSMSGQAVVLINGTVQNRFRSLAQYVRRGAMRTSALHLVCGVSHAARETQQSRRKRGPGVEAETLHILILSTADLAAHV